MEAALLESPTPPRSDGLRARLISVALKILKDQGIEALTLRAVARGACVSHGAPARHFRNLDDLKAEVAAEGLRIVSGDVSDAMAQVPPGSPPKTLLMAASRAYVNCALENPGLFSLIIRTGTLPASNDALRVESQSTYERFHRMVLKLQERGWKKGMDPKLLAGSLWSSVHGLSTLWMHGTYQQAHPDATLDDAIENILDLNSHPRSD